jgi:hypothetical protein
MEILKRMPVFCCNGKKLSLDKIQEKVINFVTINYLSEGRKVKVPEFMGMLGKRKIIQEERSIVIVDKMGIIIFFSLEQSSVSVRFRNKEEFEKLVDYDKQTLFKGCINHLAQPYQINFSIGNLKNVIWN